MVIPGAIGVIGMMEPTEEHGLILRVAVSIGQVAILGGMVEVVMDEEKEEPKGDLREVEHNPLKFSNEVASALLLGAFDDLFSQVDKKEGRGSIAPITHNNLVPWMKNFVDPSHWGQMQQALGRATRGA